MTGILVKYNLIVNVGKTENMVISSRKKELNIRVEGNCIEQVETFKYLGTKASRPTMDE